MSISDTRLVGRRYDVDWIRTIALLLLIIYHAAIAFQPFGAMIGFLTNRQPVTGLWPAMAMLNVWRIPLLFAVSGMGVWFAMQQRSWPQLLGDRTLRILVPLLFGSFAICPIYLAIAMKWFSMPVAYTPATGHLWFLANIFAYLVVLMPVFVFLKGTKGMILRGWAAGALRYPWLLFAVAAPVAAEALLVNPPSYAKYYDSLHGLLLGGIWFLTGFFLASLGEAFWNSIRRVWLPALAAAASLFMIRLTVWHTQGPPPLIAIESACWILAILGFASRHLNRPSAMLAYLSAAVYTVYIVHMPVQFGISYYLIPAAIPSVAKFSLLTAGTLLGSFALYEILSRLPWVRPLFGMNFRNGKSHPSRNEAPCGEIPNLLPSSKENW